MAVTLIVLAVGIGVWAIRTVHAAIQSRDNLIAQLTGQGVDVTLSGEVNHESASMRDLFHSGLPPRAFVTLGEQPDYYELCVVLPDSNASDAEVKIDRDRKLQVKLSRRTQWWSWNSWLPARITKTVSCTDSTTLASNAIPSGMRVERNGHELVIIVPKVGMPPKG